MSVSASFTDAGTADTHTCTITWGDGRSSTGTVSESGGSGTCTGSNVYRQTGNYTITVTVTDNAGAATTEDGVDLGDEERHDLEQPLRRRDDRGQLVARVHTVDRRPRLLPRAPSARASLLWKFQATKLYRLTASR